MFRRPVFPERVFRQAGVDMRITGMVHRQISPAVSLISVEDIQHLGVPNASLDIAWDGNMFYLLEFQCIYFGNGRYTKEFSSEYFTKRKIAGSKHPMREI